MTKPKLLVKKIPKTNKTKVASRKLFGDGRKLKTTKNLENFAQIAGLHIKNKRFAKLMADVGTALSQLFNDWESLDYIKRISKIDVDKVLDNAQKFLNSIKKLPDKFNVELARLTNDRKIVCSQDMYSLSYDIESFISIVKFWQAGNNNVRKVGASTSRARHNLYNRLFDAFYKYSVWTTENSKTDSAEKNIQNDGNEILEVEMYDKLANFVAAILDSVDIWHADVGTPEKGEEHRGQLGRLAKKYFNSYLVKQQKKIPENNSAKI